MRRGWLLAGLALAANPLLFYALEYWEHAPAVALLAGGTAAVARGTIGRVAGWPSRAARSSAPASCSGRRALWYAAGLLVTLARPHWLAFGERRRASRCSRLAGPTSCTSATRSAPTRPRCSRPSASVLPPRAGSACRNGCGRHPTLEWAGLLLVAAAWAPAPFARDLRTRQLTALLGATVVAILAAQRVMPDRAFWQGFPVALLAFVPAAAAPAGARDAVRPGVRRDRRRRAHRHQRRRRAMGHPLPADCRAAAAPAGRTRRHRRRRARAGGGHCA